MKKCAALIVLIVYLIKISASKRIKPNRLYQDFYEENIECVEGKALGNCWTNETQRTDYGCRYRNGGWGCECCGEIYHYIEFGDVCTRYCKTGETSCVPMTVAGCCSNILSLPLNYGSLSETISCKGEVRVPGPDDYEDYNDSETATKSTQEKNSFPQASLTTRNPVHFPAETTKYPQDNTAFTQQTTMLPYITKTLKQQQQQQSQQQHQHQTQKQRQSNIQQQQQPEQGGEVHFPGSSNLELASSAQTNILPPTTTSNSSMDVWKDDNEKNPMKYVEKHKEKQQNRQEGEQFTDFPDGLDKNQGEQVVNDQQQEEKPKSPLDQYFENQVSYGQAVNQPQQIENPDFIEEKVWES